MSERYKFSMWVYNPVTDFTPDELKIWKECGMTTPMAPRTSFDKDDPKELIPFLDRAAELDMKLIINYGDFAYDGYIQLGAEEYERRLREIYSVLKGHPALYGFYVGDEPNTKEHLAAVVECFRIVKKVAPEVHSFANLIGGMVDKSTETLGGCDIYGWFRKVKEASDMTVLSQDMYGQTINDNCVTSELKDLYRIVSAAAAADVPLWGNMLCSAHLAYRAQDEHGILWQVSIPAVMGCKGTLWFRFYDRSIGNEYFASPVDEYGNKTETYYYILRAQRRFADQYGEFLPKLKHKASYILGKERILPPRFEKGVHDLISIDCYEDIVIGFFEDESGKEYMAIANAYFDLHADISIFYDSEKCSLTEILLNGKLEKKVSISDPEKGYTKQCFYAGQMRLFRIDRK